MRLFIRRAMTWGCAALLCSSVTVLAPPASAQADASGKAAAEALFRNALDLMKDGRYSEACPKLEASQRVDPGVGTLLYLAECYERLGRTASAWATFREAESFARASRQADRAKAAEERARKLEADLCYLSVTVPAETRVDGLVVRRGGKIVVPELYGVAVPVDPGPIEIEATAPGHDPFTTQISVTARARESVNVPPLTSNPNASPPPALAPVAAPPAGAQPEPAEPAEPPLEPEHDYTLAYIVGGAGVIGVGVGTFFGLRAMSKNSDAEESCDDNNQCTDPNAPALTEEARDAALISNIAFAVGGAALAAGVVLFVLAPTDEQPVGLYVGPSVASGGAGLRLGGSF